MKSKASYKDLALISGNIAKLHEDGIDLLNILKLIAELPLNKQYKLHTKLMEDAINRGGTLEDAFNSENELFPKFFVSMVSVGEKTGNIVLVLKGLEVFYSKLNSIKTSIINALVYPMMLLSVLAFLIFFILFFFIPNLANIYGTMGKEVPNMYLKIINIRNFAINNTLLTVITTVLWGILLPCYVFKNYVSNNINNILRNIPIYRLVNEYVLVVLISIVVNSGINIAIGLNYCCEDSLLGKKADKLSKIKGDILRGESLSIAMRNSGIFSKYTLAHIKLGEESGSLDKRLEILQNEMFNKVDVGINKLIQLMQPVMILIMGVIVAIILIVFIMPLLDSLLIG